MKDAKERKERNMTINAMTIRMYVTSDYSAEFIHRTRGCVHSKGVRMKIGWLIMRIGGWIMFGKNWEFEKI